MPRACAGFILFVLCAAFVLHTPSPVFARDSRRALTAARRSFRAGLMPEARSKLERYLVVYPDTSHLDEILSLLSSVYMAQSDIGAGLEYLDSLEKRLTDVRAGISLNYCRADLLFRNKEYGKVLTLLETLVPDIGDDNPLRPRVRFLYAMTLFHSGLFAKAEPVFRELESDKDFGVKSSLYLSECLLELGRYATSRKVLGRVISGSDSAEYYPYSLFLSGKLDYIEGKAGEAEEAFLKADEADTSGLLKPRMSFSRAALYRKFSRFDLSNQQLELLRENSSYRTEADLMYVRNLISQQKYDEAITEVTDCIGQYHPDAVADLLFWKGEAYICKKEWGEAVDLYNSVIAQFPDFKLIDECYYRVGYSLMQSSRYAEAVDFFVRRLPEVEDNEMKIVFTRSIAESYLRLEKYELSARFYMDAAALCPEEIRADEFLLLAGRAYYHLGDWKSALDVFGEIASRTKDAQMRFKSIYSGGWVYFRQNDFKHAFGQFKTVARQLEFRLLKVKALFQMGNLYFYRGEYEKAVRYYRKIAEFFPDTNRKISEFALYRAGYCLGRIGREKEAYDTFNLLLRLFPDSTYCAQVDFTLGCQDYNNGDFYSAYSRFKAVVETFPESEFAPDAAFWLAKSIYETGNSEKTVAVLEKLLASGRKSNYQAEAELMCARVLSDLGQTERAIGVLENSAADTAMPFVRSQALLALGNIELDRGAFKKALEYYEKIPEDSVAPVMAEVGYRRGLCFLALEDDESALDVFTEVVFGLPACEEWVVASALKAGEVLEKKDRLKDAVLLYTKVKNDYVSGRGRALARLRALQGKILSAEPEK